MDEHPELEAFIGIDKDARALEEAGERLARVSTGAKVHLARCNFQDLKGWVTRILEQEGSDGIDGVVFDIGVSSMQLDEAERGFSFMRDGPLDMRMDRGSSLSAERVVNEWSESELGRILRDYGEERRWHQVAKRCRSSPLKKPPFRHHLCRPFLKDSRRIVDRRQDGRIETTKQLAEAIGKQRPSEGNAKRKLNPATRAFQAIRIAVNDELNALEEALPDAYDLLAPGGRMAVLSFHSLEDRIVKRFCFDRVKRLGGNIVTKKPIEPGQVEAETSPRSRSAKLRIVEKPKEVCS